MKSSSNLLIPDLNNKTNEKYQFFSLLKIDENEVKNNEDPILEKDKKNSEENLNDDSSF